MDGANHSVQNLDKKAQKLSLRHEQQTSQMQIEKYSKRTNMGYMGYFIF